MESYVVEEVDPTSLQSLAEETWDALILGNIKPLFLVSFCGKSDP